MSTLGIDHINLRAPRAVLEELKRFYCEVVGLVDGERPPFDSFGYWLYAGERAVVHLSEAREDAPRPSGNAGTFDHVAFSCRDRAALETRLWQCSIAFTVAQVPGRPLVQIFLQDPAGNGVELNFAGGD